MTPRHILRISNNPPPLTGRNGPSPHGSPNSDYGGSPAFPANMTRKARFGLIIPGNIEKMPHGPASSAGPPPFSAAIPTDRANSTIPNNPRPNENGKPVENAWKNCKQDGPNSRAKRIFFVIRRAHPHSFGMAGPPPPRRNIPTGAKQFHEGLFSYAYIPKSRPAPKSPRKWPPVWKKVRENYDAVRTAPKWTKWEILFFNYTRRL